LVNIVIEDLFFGCCLQIVSETLDCGAEFLSYNGTRGGTVLLHFVNVLLDQRSSVCVSWFDVDRKRQIC
jgi:hypothetical protein